MRTFHTQTLSLLPLHRTSAAVQPEHGQTSNKELIHEG